MVNCLNPKKIFCTFLPNLILKNPFSLPFIFDVCTNCLNFLSAKGKLQIRDCRKGDARSSRMEKAAGVRNTHTRPNQRTETENHRKNRLGKQVSVYSNLDRNRYITPQDGIAQNVFFNWRWLLCVRWQGSLVTSSLRLLM